MHRSLMEPPGKAKKAGMDGGGGEPHHPQVAALAREAMIEDSSLTGSGKKKAVQHHGSVGFLLASHALTGSENKKSSIFGQGANHVVDQTKTANKKAVAGQNAQGAGPYPPLPRAASFDTSIPAVSSRGHSPFVSPSLQAGAMCFGRRIRGNRQRSSWSWTSIGT
jgi:hypothetical protein